MSEPDTKNEPLPPSQEGQPRGGAAPRPATKEAVAETGGPKGPDPTRFGDWERKGRCIDF